MTDKALPPSATPSAFIYLLNAFENATQADDPRAAGYPEARKKLLEYAAKLEAAWAAKLERETSTPSERGLSLPLTVQMIQDAKRLEEQGCMYLPVPIRDILYATPQAPAVTGKAPSALAGTEQPAGVAPTADNVPYRATLKFDDETREVSGTFSVPSATPLLSLSGCAPRLYGSSGVRGTLGPFGLQMFVDPSLPEDTMEFRDGVTGRVLGKIINVGRE